MLVKNYQFVQINHINQLNFQEQIKIVKHRKIPNEKLKNFYRTPAKIKLLNLYNSKPSKDRFKRPETPARIVPDRKWFGNTRTITQKKLEEIRKEISLNEKNKKNP